MATSADFSINRIDSFSQILGISHIPEGTRIVVSKAGKNHKPATSCIELKRRKKNRKKKERTKRRKEKRREEKMKKAKIRREKQREDRGNE